MQNRMNQYDRLTATVASFRNFPSEQPIKNSVVIFWESHTNNKTDKERIKSTIDLIHKRFDLETCEKYEVRTGYLSRYNYLSKPLEESSIEELQEAIIKGEEEQSGWIDRCSPEMPAFRQVNWQKCVSERINPYFRDCREKLLSKIKEEESFWKAYHDSASAYAIKRHTNLDNGLSYLVEENAWILSLPYVFSGKKIYIIHVGNVTESTLILFSEFEYLKNSTLLLFPTFSHEDFATVSDFKLEYENKDKLGYFVEDLDFSAALHEKNNLQDLSNELIAEKADKELLSNIVAQLPGHIYWMNNKFKYIGCNDLQAKHLGLSSREDIVGKTVFDLLPAPEATKHSNINKLVIERGKTYSGKEKITTQDSKTQIYLSTKVPLVNHVGERVGLLGVSVDITDREEAIELRKQNELKKYELEKQEEFHKFTESIAHDIRSPLMILLYIANNVSLPDQEHSLIRNAVATIERIVDGLFDSRWKEPLFTQDQYICVQTTLKEIVRSASYQYKSKDVEFEYIEDHIDNSCRYHFVKGDSSDFYRMMFNLVNNAVEAIPNDRKGFIKIGFSVNNDHVTVVVKDNGKGMSSEIVQRITSGQFVGSSKENGHGLGTRQVFENVKKMQGLLYVDSKENVGTTFKLTFKICDVPKWFSDEVVLHKGDTIVILDDDSSVFGLWKRIFANFGEEVSVKYFTKGNDAIGFINSLEDKSNVFVITDYELRGQAVNGVDVIEKAGTQARNLLVTSVYTSKIKDFDKKCDMFKIFPKSEGIDKIKIIAA